MMNRWKNNGKSDRLYFGGGSKITADGDCRHEIKRHLLLGRKAMTNLGIILKSKDITLPKKGLSSQCYGFSSSHVWMWDLEHKEGWVQNWCFWTVVLEKTLESHLDSKEIKPVNSKGNQPWIFFGKTDVEVEASILRPPDAKSHVIGKDPDDGKDWRQEKRKQRMRCWMASSTKWMWVSVNFGTYWRTGKPGTL